MSRLDKIDDWLNHEPCCDHSGADEHGCWDCLNTGHTHGSTITFEDAQALVKFAKAARAVIDGDYTMWDDPADAMAGDLSRALNELEQDA